MVRLVQQFRKQERFQAPSPDLLRLYTHCRMQVRESLRAWQASWLLPPLLRVRHQPSAGVYLRSPHLIGINLDDVALLRQVEKLWQDLEHVRQMREASMRDVPFDWEPFLDSLRQCIARNQQEQKQHIAPRVAALWSAWISFQQQLLDALEWCQRKEIHGPALHEVETALLSQCQLLSAFSTIAWRQLRRILLHELVHAASYRKSGENEQGDFSYWLGIAYYTDTDTDTNARYEGMNEAITEWITTRIVNMGEEVESSWSFFHTPYTEWIIQEVAEALDQAWKKIETAVPEVKARGICCASDLFYAAYFSGSDYLLLLKRALICLAEDEEAFENVAQACDRLREDVMIEPSLIEESMTHLLWVVEERSRSSRDHRLEAKGLFLLREE